ncbi:hypothetical protein WMY93_017705 [Mugilogobius chulae]|uniref:TIR domain-containing protein n=1 Tax=Mugilogobius chulae TaxID=88201 RepID=A0AAW0NQ56_9GOBI
MKVLMDSTLLLTFLLLLALLWTSSHSSTGPEQVHCAVPDLDHLFLLEGESLWFIPYGVDQNSSFTWYWNNSQDVLQLSSEETDPVHAHGPALFVLNATTERSGCFLLWEKDFEGSLKEYYHVLVHMVPKDSKDRLFSVTQSGTNTIPQCPNHVYDTCERSGNLSWHKGCVQLPGQDQEYVVIPDAKTEDQYDCVCTWSHQNHLYQTVGTTRVIINGARLRLNCTVLCGTNLPAKQCVAVWRAKNSDLDSEGYNLTKHVDIDRSKKTIVIQTLTIERVSAAHFEDTFECVGMGRFGDPVSISVQLQPRQSILSLAAPWLCVFLLFVFIAVTVKCFVVDLVLLSRRLFPFRMGDTELKDFDAYVVYQQQSQDKPTEEALGHFVFQDLPHVLENKCGYRLFIHGRDDLPGEDHVELVEERMRKSRRLMVILTPHSGSEVTDKYQPSEGYDWQVNHSSLSSQCGLHQALVQRDLSVILIQLGETGPGGYSHLPPALQHLIQKSAPIMWTQESRTARVNSRFWKRVRYLMPATPVKASQNMLLSSSRTRQNVRGRSYRLCCGLTSSRCTVAQGSDWTESQKRRELSRKSQKKA